jgi:hypothetical protein
MASFARCSVAVAVFVVMAEACGNSGGPPLIGDIPCSVNCMPNEGDGASYSLPAICFEAGASESPVFIPLAPPDVPACCATGFEIGDAPPGSQYTLNALSSLGAQAITVDIDYATYRDADEVVVIATDATNTATTILDTCKLITSTDGDPTQGLVRPPDITIRQFHMQVPQGTVQLAFNFAGVVSPMYIQALGLCDFDLPSFKATSWRLANAYGASDAAADAPTCD